ncbi:hypothetical protein BaRGS_00035170 [Batillaria attramentaria]|uniref:Secreted protein n=1 Tax=Batillaria attramentaria TaxID=370345 RepID=A0ABD0JGR7_9CAEN
MASLSSVAALLFVAVIHVNGASTVYPLPSTLYGTNQQICNYQFAVPPGSNCVRTGQDLKQQITALQDDVQRTKLSNVQQNTILQEQIDKLNKQAAVTDAGVADLTREFRNLQATIAALQATVTQLGQGGGGGGSGSSSGTGTGTTTTNIYNNAAMQQLVTQTRTQLTTDILRLETEINRVKRDHQQDSIQQSKVLV